MPAPDRMRAPLWHRMAAAAGLVDDTGAVAETIFGQMTALATATDAVNLGQGAPGTPAPAAVIEAAGQAMAAGQNQYAPGQGVPALIEAVITQQAREYGRQVAPEEVLVTVGATEAITATVLALVPEGGRLVVFEPFYDSYAAAAEAAGAELVTIPILPDGKGGCVPDWAAFEAAVAGSASAILLNTPHNPTGLVFDAAAIRRVHAAAEAADAWLITDEVYEYLTFDGTGHVPPATVVEDADRVVTISSAGKSLNITGWKIGWLIARPEVRQAIQAVKQFLTFTSGTPLQPAVASMLVDHPEAPVEIRDSLAARRDLLVPALRAVPGLELVEPQGGYFVLADFAALTSEDAFAVNRRLAEEFGVVGIPVAGLCRAGSPAAERYRQTIRYSFCKAPAEVEAAVEKFAELARAVEAGTF